MITIGVTYTGSEAKHQNYVNWLTASGEEIKIINFSEKENNASLIDDCNGILLSGGLDIEPDLYGGDTAYENAPDEFDPARDQFEINLYKKACEKKIPLLGICRGFQLINCVEGGTLHQDLGDTLNDTHFSKAPPPFKTHKVLVEKNTLLYGIVISDSGFVSSSHHQAIDKLADTLMVNSKAEDNTIEGVEWKDKDNKSFMLAVQWHPEWMFRFELEGTPLAKNIRDRFIKEAKQFKLDKQ